MISPAEDAVSYFSCRASRERSPAEARRNALWLTSYRASTPPSGRPSPPLRDWVQDIVGAALVPACPIAGQRMESDFAAADGQSLLAQPNNNAYHHGGFSQTMDEVSRLLGIPVDHYITVDLSTHV